AQILDQQGNLFVIVLTAEVHFVGNHAVALLGGGVFGVERDDLGQVHSVGSTMDDVGAVVGKSRAGLVRHAVDDAQQRVGERHAGQSLSVVHGIAFGHIAVVAAYQILLDHLNGVQRQRVGKVAVRGGNIR